MIELLRISFNDIIEKFKTYFGTYLYFPLFILTLIIVFFVTKKTDYTKRTICFWLPIVAMLVVFNPITHIILNPFVKIGNDYWRFFWLIPIAIVMGFVFTKLTIKVKKNYLKAIIITFIGIVLFSCGKLVYSKENFQKVNNYYKMPDEILDIIRIVQQGEGNEKKLMVPISVVPWVRQYDGNISVMYYRSSKSIYSQYVIEFDSGIINKYMKKFMNEKCNYIIINNKECDCDFNKYGYELCGENSLYKAYYNDKLN